MTRYRSTALPAAALAALLVAGCGGEEAALSSSPAATTAGPSAGAAAAHNDADVMFAQMMIPHHEEAVEMAGLAATRAGKAEVKALAERIAAGQRAEVATMRGWLTAWGAEASAGDDMGHEMPGAVSAADLDRLEGATGASFDRQFLTMMIAHHEGATSMAEDEVADGSDPAATALARQVIATQRAEIAEMRDLLRTT